LALDDLYREEYFLIRNLKQPLNRNLEMAEFIYLKHLYIEECERDGEQQIEWGNYE
jgi:hypothetical protein